MPESQKWAIYQVSTIQYLKKATQQQKYLETYINSKIYLEIG